MNVVLATLAATTLIQTGYFLWKLSADRQPRAGAGGPLAIVRALLTDWRWLLGFAALSAGWLLFVQATSLGEISVVQPLMSAGDVLLIALAVVFLHERLGRIEWLGVGLTVIGAVLLASGADDRPTAAFDAPLLCALVSGAVATGAALVYGGRRMPRPETFLALAVGLAFGIGAVLTEAMTAAKSRSGESVLSVATLFDPLLLGVILANTAGLVLLQMAFRRGRAAVVVPLQLASANALTVAAGMAVFGETPTVPRIGAIALIVVGTGLLHLRNEGATVKPAADHEPSSETPGTAEAPIRSI